MEKKKIIIGITAYQSIVLIHGQLKYMSTEFDMYLLAPEHDSVKAFCQRENAQHIPIIIERNPSLFKDLITLFTLIKIFIKIKPDIINLGTLKISFLGIIAGWFAGVKNRIYTCRGFRFEHETGLTKVYLLFFEKIISTLSTKIICISRSVADLGIEKGLFNRKKIVYFGNGSSNGLDISLFNKNEVDNDLAKDFRQKHEFESNFIFGYVGRLIDRKGINELYHIFDEIYNDDKNVRLLVVGSFFVDQVADKTLIEKYNTHPGIIMTGAQPINLVPTYMSVMDLLVLPAWWEGFGNVLIQAAAMGVAVLSTNSTGCKDAVNNDFNGKLIKPKSEIELKYWMNELRRNATMRAEYAKNATTWAENFDSKIIWSAMMDFYKSVEK